MIQLLKNVGFFYFLFEYFDITKLMSARMINNADTTKMVIATPPITLNDIR